MAAPVKAMGLTVLNVVRSARALGLDTRGLFEGLSVSEADLEAGQVWVPWSETVVVFKLLEPSLEQHHHEPLIRLHMQTHPAIRVLAQLAVSSAAWLELFAAWSRPANPMAELTLRTEGSMAEFRYELLPGLEPCLLWFQLTHHAFRFALLPAGGPPLETLAVEVSDRRSLSRFRVPPGPPAGELAGELPLHTILDSLDVLGAHLGPAIRDGHLAFDPSVRSHVNDVATLAEAWGLTPSEARVTLSLGEGRSPAEVAEALGMAVGTARVHLRSVYSKTETTGQRELVARLKAWRLT